MKTFFKTIILFFSIHLFLFSNADNSLKNYKHDSCKKVINVLNYDLINNTRDKDDFFNIAFIQSILSSIIGSLIGAGMAIPCGLWLDRKIKGKQSMELIKNINKLLILELDANKESLSDYLNSNRKNTKLPKISFAAWQVALGQNYLTQCGNIEINNSLTNSYDKLHYIEKISNSYFELLILGQTAMPSYVDKLTLMQDALQSESKDTITLILNSLSLIMQYEKHN